LHVSISLTWRAYSAGNISLFGLCAMHCKTGA
jgi:hypothetical protein